jgi:hypothetical protein
MEAGMTWIAALALALASAFVLVLLIPVFAFRFAVPFLTGRTIGWFQSLAAVLLAGLVQGCARVALGGLAGAALREAGFALGGLDSWGLGALVGWMVWSLVAGVAGIPFGRALLVGLVMAVVSWLLWFALIVWLLFTGAALGLGVAGLALLG